MINTYKISHITDLANIPEEAFDRFLSEAPAIYKQVRAIKTVCDMFGGDVKSALKEIEWRDDNSNHVDIEFTCEGKSLGTLKVNGE